MKEIIPEFWQSLSDLKNKTKHLSTFLKREKNPFRIMLGLLGAA